MSVASPSAGEIIYKAFVPTLKMALCILAGFVMAKVGSLPAASIRGISLITLNLSLPCLIFASMVSAFTPETVSAFGPLLMMAIMYQILGGLLAFVVSEVFYVPSDFRWGILVMGVISNWGNLPTAVVQTIAKETPFNPETDVDLGVAYIAIFILVMNSTFFALGVHKVCGWDFIGDHMLGEPLPLLQRWKNRITKLRRTIITARPICGTSKETTSPTTDLTGLHAIDMGGLHKKVSRERSFSVMIDSCNPIAPTTSLDAPSNQPASGGKAEVCNELETTLDHAPPVTANGLCSLRRPPSTRRILAVLRSVPPATWSVVLGLLFSLIQPLKSLLTVTSGWTESRMPNAPDNNPPLHFILDTTAYIGAMTVPLGLMLLGSSFARMKLPTRWRDLPLMAILCMTAVKMVIVPIFSVFVVQALQKHTSLFPPEQKIRTFVTILLSGTPAAVNQLVVTQLYNPAGTAHTLASFLLLQYVLMFILSTGLAAIALYIVK